MLMLIIPKIKECLHKFYSITASSIRFRFGAVSVPARVDRPTGRRLFSRVARKLEKTNVHLYKRKIN